MPRKPSEIDWAWFAGIFEGEGSITFTGKNSVELRISMTDEDVVERCYEIAGGRFYREQTRSDRNGHKPVFRWKLQVANEVIAVLDRIEPYLGNRRWMKTQEARVRLVRVRRPGYCKQGHLMGGDNLYVAPGSGHTGCRQCGREQSRNWQAENNRPKIKGTTRQCASCGIDFIARSPTHKYCDDHSEWSKRKVAI